MNTRCSAVLSLFFVVLSTAASQAADVAPWTQETVVYKTVGPTKIQADVYRPDGTQPRPTALVAYWGYGDVDGSWYTEPSAHYRQQPLVEKAAALDVVGKGVLTSSSGRPRGVYYLYLRQNGLWTQEVTGFDPRTERSKLDPFCPVRNITASYPPILMIHGTADTDVPYERSAEMAAELKKHGVPHELITVEGGGHGLPDKTNPAVIDAFARARAFIQKHLGP
jgi:dipeptidyl aminopeptidase/acylaminoacyl peptidase